MTTAPAPISLVIATFNRGDKICSTLESALSQKHAFSEIIVVDDCSTDGTGDLVASRFPEVIVARTPRTLFTAGARNFGARAATGPVLAFLDHDDELLPHASETLLSLLATFPSAEAAFADHEYIDIRSEIRFRDHHSSQPAFARLADVPPVETAAGSSRLYGRALYRALLWGNLLQQPWLVRRVTFERLGGFSEHVRYCEDWDLYCRLLRRSHVALSDTVISRHIVEGANLHLAPGQHEMHVSVLKSLAASAKADVYTRSVVRRRLAIFDKYHADLARNEGRSADAIRGYRASFAKWPLDFVVALRALGLPGFR